jgi:hypothetical protein
MDTNPKSQGAAPGGAPSGPKSTQALRQKRRRRATPYLIALCLIGILVAMLIPAVQQAREAAHRSSCKCNLKQLGLALHNYHEANGCFPPAFIADAQGRPMHSWRVLILPQIDQMALYKKYRFDEPWDGPHNILLLDEIPPIYKCPTHCPPARNLAGSRKSFGVLACGSPWTITRSNRPDCTNYAAVLGTDCAFRGAIPVLLADIADGTSNTFLVGEVTDADIPWTKPEDIDVSKHPQIGDRLGFSSDHTSGAHFLTADGAVRFVSVTTPQATIDALFTRNAGDSVGEY